MAQHRYQFLGVYLVKQVILAALTAALMAVLSATSANAALIRWTLAETFFDTGNDASFDLSGPGPGPGPAREGPCLTAGTCGSVEGFFIFDTATGNPIDWAFTVRGGDTAAFSEFVYTPANSRDANSDNDMQFERTDIVSTPPRVLYVEGPGARVFETPGTERISRLTECFNCVTFRSVRAQTSVTGVIVDVPAPASLPLLLAGLGAMAIFGRRRGRQD